MCGDPSGMFIDWDYYHRYVQPMISAGRMTSKFVMGGPLSINPTAGEKLWGFADGLVARVEQYAATLEKVDKGDLGGALKGEFVFGTSMGYKIMDFASPVQSWFYERVGLSRKYVEQFDTEAAERGYRSGETVNVILEVALAFVGADPIAAGWSAGSQLIRRALPALRSALVRHMPKLAGHVGRVAQQTLRSPLVRQVPELINQARNVARRVAGWFGRSGAPGATSRTGLTSGRMVESARAVVTRPWNDYPFIDRAATWVRNIHTRIRFWLGGGRFRVLANADDLADNQIRIFMQMADLTKATGREIALFRGRDGAIYMAMGQRNRIPGNLMTDATELIAHTHPSGRLGLSWDFPNSGNFLDLNRLTGDVGVLQRLGQESTIVIGPSGRYHQFNLSDWMPTMDNLRDMYRQMLRDLGR